MLGVNCFCQHCICQGNLPGRYDNVTALSIVLCINKGGCKDQTAVVYLLENTEKNEKNKK